MVDTNYYYGMHWVWWFVWLILLIWIFAIPYNIPGQRYKRNTPLEILQARFASGEVTIEEYNEKKQILEGGMSKA